MDTNVSLNRWLRVYPGQRVDIAYHASSKRYVSRIVGGNAPDCAGIGIDVEASLQNLNVFVLGLLTHGEGK